MVAMPLPARNVADRKMLLVVSQCMGRDVADLLMASLESGELAKPWILLLSRSLAIIFTRYIER